MSPELAALFWICLERRASIILAAGPPSSGKTTILTALFAFLPPETQVYFTRGWGETFDLPPLREDVPTYILVNEMSDDLPVYSWGPYVVRVFELLAEGYSLGSTMHADTAEEVVAQLAEDNGVPQAHLAHLTLVAALALPHKGGRVLRRLNEVALLGPGDGAHDDLSLTTVSSWEAEGDSFRLLEGEGSGAALARRLGLSESGLRKEMKLRGRFLAELVREGVLSNAAVENAVAGYRAGLNPESGR
jgi:energy-coupling factor transporter ATP-binding protein EcfA2